MEKTRFLGLFQGENPPFLAIFFKKNPILRRKLPIFEPFLQKKHRRNTEEKCEKTRFGPPFWPKLMCYLLWAQKNDPFWGKKVSRYGTPLGPPKRAILRRKTAFFFGARGKRGGVIRPQNRLFGPNFPHYFCPTRHFLGSFLRRKKWVSFGVFFYGSRKKHPKQHPPKWPFLGLFWGW